MRTPHSVTLATISCLIVSTFAAAAAAAATDPRQVLFDGVDGATCRYFNVGGQILWQQPLGDWTDARNVSRGTEPFSSARIAAARDLQMTTWDLTRLVQAWTAPDGPTASVLLLPLGPGGQVNFASRESPLARLRPRLVVTLRGPPETVTLTPIADTTLDCSTRRSRGMQPVMQVGPSVRAALQFDVAPLGARRVVKATLEIGTSEPVRRESTVGVFQLTPLQAPVARSDAGTLATRHPGDEGVDGDSDVWFAANFESPEWRTAWSYVSPVSNVERVEVANPDPARPPSGHALRVRVAKGSNFGLDMGYDFQGKLGFEPEEAYLRYYLRFDDDWLPTVDGGKLPGLSGTYGKSGWGGRRTDGTTGWSMRGSFNREPSPNNPLYGRTTVGTYAYHTDTQSEFGDHWFWTGGGGAGVLERNRWYCLEQRVKLNTPGEHDGIVQAWVDGVLALDRRDISMRITPALRIERVWMNVYHGGTAPADRDMHLVIDNVVVAPRPIGCGARR